MIQDVKEYLPVVGMVVSTHAFCGGNFWRRIAFQESLT